MSRGSVVARHVRLVIDAPRGVTRAAMVYSWCLALVGGAVFVVVAALGGGFPPLVPTMFLVLVLALCVGRVALYPSGLAATAELAVILCAVVAFRADAPVSGPLLLALLVGPLDRDHWRARSFLRMAYNSGNRALAALGATSVLAMAGASFGDSTGALAVGMLLAAVTAAVVDGVVTVGLVTCLGGSARAARRELLDIDALALPLAVAGGAVGFLATGVGWWVAAVPLVALALVPELLQARARVPARFARGVLLVLELVVTLVVVGVFATPPSWPTALVLGALAVLVGVDLVVDARVPVPPVLAIFVAAAAVVGSQSAAFSAALVAVVATATAWSCGAGSRSAGATLGIVVAAAAGVLAGLAVTTADDPTTVMALAICGVAVFGACVIGVARSGRRGLVIDLLWSTPLLVGAVTIGVVPDVRSPAAGSFAGLALVVAVLLGAWCGSTPWQSRFLSRRFGGASRGGRTAVCVALSALAVVGVVAALADHSADRTVVAVGVLVTGGIATTMAAWAIRQWRLAPRARTRLAGAIGLNTALACAGAFLVVDDPAAALAVGIVAALLAAIVGFRTLRTADRVH